MRVALWLAILGLLALGRLLHDDRLTALVAPLVFVALWFGAPRGLRGAIALLGASLLAGLVIGGPSLVVELLPCAVAALIGWLFARSLLLGRQPLIERAIARMDGPAPLEDPEILRYARGLTRAWALFQFALALFGLACIAAARGLLQARALPDPQRYGVVILPLAVIVLFVGEFFLRPRLLPQAPHRSLPGFVRDLARAWPGLVED